MLLIAYDGECSLCIRRADWLKRQDTQARLMLFPLQHPELVRMAPELAGRSLHGQIHGIDLTTREVFAAGELLDPLLTSLPRWRWLRPLMMFPGLRTWIGRWLLSKI
ncbi:MAG: DCC1-like thiol-disulfide oxidoreductase family protein [Holophagaceae bacterium]|jgi:predicted DCC family thiol-disulfide oxidoreductase YuxK